MVNTPTIHGRSWGNKCVEWCESAGRASIENGAGTRRLRRDGGRIRARSFGPPSTPVRAVSFAFPSSGHQRGHVQTLAVLCVEMPGRVLRRAEVVSTVHGFRSSVRSWMAETGVPAEVVEACLAHVPRSQVRSGASAVRPAGAPRRGYPNVGRLRHAAIACRGLQERSRLMGPEVTEPGAPACDTPSHRSKEEECRFPAKKRANWKSAATTT